MEKGCSQCGKTKVVSEFQIRTASKDGLTSACKVCLKKRDKIRDSDPKRIKARADYAKTPNGIERGNAAKKKWEKNNQLCRAAHVLTGNAIRDGLLIKKPCEMCKTTANIQAHHDDYYKPLEVKWLCSKCHKIYHKTD